MSTSFSSSGNPGFTSSESALSTPEAVVSALDDLSLQIAEIKCQVQSFERDLSMLTLSLETTKGSLNAIADVTERIRIHSAEQFENLLAGKKAEDEMRDAVTSSFSDMFQALNKVFSTAQKMGIAPQSFSGAAPSRLPEMPSHSENPEQSLASPGPPDPAPNLEKQTPPEPVAEEPVAEEPVAEEPVVEEPVAEELVVEELVVEEPVVEEPVAEELVVEEPVVEEPVVEEPVAEEPVAEELVVEEPVVEEIAEELPASETFADDEFLTEGEESEFAEEPLIVDAAATEPISAMPIIAEEEDDDDEYEDIEGDPDAVADLLAGLSSSFSTDLPDPSQIESGGIDADDVAELEKLLGGK